MKSFDSVNWRIPRAKILSREEVARILKAAKETDLRDYVFLAIAANVGLRLCEIVHIRRDDVDADSIVVTRRKKKVLAPEAAAIQESLSKVTRNFIDASKNGSPWLFPGHSTPCLRGREKLCDGGHVSRREIQRRWESYLKVCKLSARGRGIHSLRHYAVTTFYATHKDLRAAQMFAGHTSPLITQVYAHVVDMKEKVQKVKVTL